MSKPFDDIRFVWDGEERVIPANNLFAAIKRVEDCTASKQARQDLIEMGQPRPSIIVEAMVSLIRFAGGEADELDVYRRMNVTEADEEIASVGEAMNKLMGAAAPPPTVAEKSEKNRSRRAGSRKTLSSSPLALGE